MKFRLDEKHYPLLATFVVCALLYLFGAVSYRHFASPQVFADFFSENAPLGIAALGLTFVILSGGIDLSVASVMALSTMVIAGMTARLHVHPALAVLSALAVGTLIGWVTGLLVHIFELPPFLVTLATLFLARGACFLVSMTPIDVSGHNLLGRAFAAMDLSLAGVAIRARAWILLALVILGVLVARFTRFGRGVYALGGNEQAAKLMGLPVGRIKVGVYTLGGFCSALAGVISMSMISSGDPIKYMGYELDAIAAVVIGGTLLTGGVGYVAGTLLGVLILALIQTIIVFDGRLDSSWTRIITGLLLFAFIALQKLLTRFRLGRSKGRFPAAAAPA
jgi:simple sugar transport system permease protein